MERPTIEKTLAAHGGELLARDGVVGVAQGVCDDEPCIRVFVTEAAASRLRLPSRLEGHRVCVAVSGRFVAYTDSP